MFKVELIIGDVTLNTTPEADVAARMLGTSSGNTTLVNWEDVKICKKRSEFGEVERIVTDSFQFCGEAAKMIRAEYYGKGLANAAGQVVISRLIDKSPDIGKLLTFEKVEQLDLDFSTFRDDTVTVEIGTHNNSLAAIIKAKKSQVYDIPVEGIKESRPLDYDRIEISFIDRWFMGGELPAERGVYRFVAAWHPSMTVMVDKWLIPMLVNETGGTRPPVITVSDISSSIDEGKRLIVANEKCSLFCNFEFDFKIEEESGYMYSNTLFFIKNKGKENENILLEINTGIGENYTIKYNEVVDLLNGDDLGWYFFKGYNIQTPSISIATITNVESLSVSYLYREPRHYDIDLVRPKALLSELLKQMTGRDIVCEMPAGSFTNYTYFSAAESVRGIPKAKIHTSFNKFNDWMNCNGYAFMIKKRGDGSEYLTFVSRDNLYDDSEVTEINEVRDLEISINQNAIYSGIEIGYEKKEYDEVNGRFEFNVQHSYSTGLTVYDNVKTLISPYRADCFGIEFLVRKREGTKDSDSDNDLFVISAYSTGGDRFFIDRSFYPIFKTDGDGRPDYLFNGRYSPSNMLQRSLSYLGANAVEMLYTSTEGSENTIINNKSEHRDMVITNRLFRSEILKCTSYAHSYKELPLYQLIQFNHKGLTYKGFIYDVTEQLVPGVVELELICYSIEEQKEQEEQE